MPANIHQHKADPDFGLELIRTSFPIFGLEKPMFEPKNIGLATYCADREAQHMA